MSRTSESTEGSRLAATPRARARARALALALGSLAAACSGHRAGDAPAEVVEPAPELGASAPTKPPPSAPPSLPDRAVRPPKASQAHDFAQLSMLGSASLNPLPPAPASFPTPAPVPLPRDESKQEEAKKTTATKTAKAKTAKAKTAKTKKTAKTTGDDDGDDGDNGDNGDNASPVAVPSDDNDGENASPVAIPLEPEGADSSPFVTAPPAYFVPVVPRGDATALTRFHDALRRLDAPVGARQGTDVASAGPGAGSGAGSGEGSGEGSGDSSAGKVRVLMYGASGTAADFGAGYLRLYLQHRFGDGGPGFIPLGRMNRWYRHNEVTVEASKGWRKEHAQWPKGRMDGHYGLLGASFASSSKRDWVRVLSKPEAHSAGAWSSAELQFLRQPGGGRMRVVVEGERPEITLASLTVATAADEIAPGYHAIALPPGTGAISVRPVGDGEVRLFGVVIERDGRGVVVDTLGINGTRAANQLKWNETIWRDAIARRKPALVTLSYGTNESVGGKEDVPLPQYREELEVVLTRLRDAAPDASCVLILPTDYPILDKDARELQPRPRLLEIMEIQRELGPAHGCGVWDGLAFMGGFGAMARWVHADPPLARGDYLHFTRRGSVLKSMVLSDALLLEYDWAADPSLTPVPLAAERGL